MSKKQLRWFALAVVLLLGPAIGTSLAAECWSVDRSRAVNDWGAGTGWCEGWWNADCQYCWDSSGGGGTCATNVITGCDPQPEQRPY